MGVLEDQRHKGVGRHMVDKIKEKAKADKVPLLVVAHGEAVAFYERCGFRALGEFRIGARQDIRPHAVMRWDWEDNQ
jgi:predicted N-acetyltransferase YhbS